MIVGTFAVIVKSLISPPLPPLRVAFQVCNSMEENRARFDTLSAWLEKRLGRKIIASHVNTFDFVEMAQKQKFDILQTNGYIYVNVKDKIGGAVLGGVSV